LNAHPILYSFRRCPYAIRTRMALKYSQIKLELREIVLKNKPRELLDASPKGTVPVLILPSGEVLEESLEIMLWALNQSDPDDWFPLQQQSEILAWIQKNDHEFKPHLDRYKYADRYPEYPMTVYRERLQVFYQNLETSLSQNNYLCGAQITLADIALFPFIRQSAFVDKAWFDEAAYPCLQKWLRHWLNSDLFQVIMPKYPAWTPNSEIVFYNGN